MNRSVQYRLMQRGPYDYRAFITGSHAYGVVRESSDVDVVVCSPAIDLRKSAALPDSFMAFDKYHESNTQLLRAHAVGGTRRHFDLICAEPREWEAWWDATQWLIAHAPVTRAFAIEVITWAKKNPPKRDPKQRLVELVRALGDSELEVELDGALGMMK